MTKKQMAENKDGIPDVGSAPIRHQSDIPAYSEIPPIGPNVKAKNRYRELVKSRKREDSPKAQTLVATIWDISQTPPGVLAWLAICALGQEGAPSW
jgi:hypothetical protein